MVKSEAVARLDENNLVNRFALETGEAVCD